jgi:hypothetical protein
MEQVSPLSTRRRVQDASVDAGDDATDDAVWTGIPGA